MKQTLNDLNYQDWSYECEVNLKSLGLQKHIKFASFDAYYATVPKSEIEKEYLLELEGARGVNQNEIDQEKERIKKEWKKERLKFLSVKDSTSKRWREEDEKPKGKSKSNTSQQPIKWLIYLLNLLVEFNMKNLLVY